MRASESTSTDCLSCTFATSVLRIHFLLRVRRVENMLGESGAKSRDDDGLESLDRSSVRIDRDVSVELRNSCIYNTGKD